MKGKMTKNDLLSRMRNGEEQFVERKSSNDKKGWVKTVVAFANSAPNGCPCVLYVGVTDKGEFEKAQNDLDKLQRTFNDEMKRIYPPAAYYPEIIEKDGKKALAVIVYGSEFRPHFAGPSYVRKGSESPEASEEQFEELIARRNSKANKILSFKGQEVTVVFHYETVHPGGGQSLWTGIVVECNQFWLTLERLPEKKRMSFSLSHLVLSFDDEKNRLRIELTEVR